jgi:lycopene beta-cyclase
MSNSDLDILSMAGAASEPFDYVLVGGGLGNALIALAVFEAQPRARVALVEQASAVGGNHLWCFHAGDLPESHDFVTPLVGARWPRYEVRFPELQRTLDESYAAVRSEQLAEVVQAAFRRRPDSRLVLGARASHSSAHRVQLADGSELAGRVVIESRGPEAFSAGARSGFQKFLGLELKLKRPCPLRAPLLMDALVSQQDGYRFMYVLPFEPDRVLLEDTYFSDTSELDVPRLKRGIFEYAAQNGFDIAEIVREEVGLLPLPTRPPRLARPAEDAPLVAGYQGGWFHPVTGYSFPVAARVAAAVASCDAERLRSTVWPRLLRAQRAQLRFGTLLNRLFFDAFAPEQRHHVIARFYGLSPELVRRFYALDMTPADRARIVCGRPPRGFSVSRILSGGGSPSPALAATGGAPS